MESHSSFSIDELAAELQLDEAFTPAAPKPRARARIPTAELEKLESELRAHLLAAPTPPAKEPQENSLLHSDLDLLEAQLADDVVRRSEDSPAGPLAGRSETSLQIDRMSKRPDVADAPAATGSERWALDNGAGTTPPSQPKAGTDHFKRSPVKFGL
ncbi:hypothetical protein AB1Y20_019105 [Prymnesium parvum]|uniref:Centrosomal protein of 19 kDa n=1 Tax=Prymnesium parvum TaxID=97485 RepID=A0AB34JT70_PRYPA|mmetsp:Transcript_17107/g.39188  ORF Transcript_17107/g.39188 Transcript_17107/m.39188 type:complete len:157 (-) Transcript_17107:298-768(-)